MASLATAELCDANPALIAKGELRVLQPVFQMFGHHSQSVRGQLTRGRGVLVIDGGGACGRPRRRQPGQLAQNMGWAGILVNGCIRDVDEINGCDVGVRALGSHPLKSNKKGLGEKHVSVNVGGAVIQDGEWLYADSDGILISKTEISI
ncbi:putative 4-hydroxy-4-methyl-2-oxoglutarate aldolase 3 [Ananas comosus]|uniref:Putative 4-hydroxy-4-methyl-2-oxoglutarate aldolase 3 n=1 Tax=Ananas comosus TaxID=4615 RepID=A0A199UX50_ANACO|nr:putative 4-hydroxy-4-methyl-2-oxoglutarate aldolase 3 [Ananas comosus]